MTMQEGMITDKLAALKRSHFRSRFRLTQKELGYIGDKGLETIREHAYDFIAQRIAPAFPYFEGKQTPMRGHPVFIAQHATATCCRGCLNKWHGIGKGKTLSVEEVDDIVKLVMGWIDVQVDASGTRSQA